MGMTPPIVALFRAREDALRSAEALSRRGVAATLAPVVELNATGASPPEGPFDFIVATSAKAISLASPAALAAARAPLYVVGERTAAAARRRGLAPQAVAANIAALTPGLPKGRALYLAGADRKPDLEAALGARSITLIVYEARARANWDEAEASGVASAGAALHYSERSAALALALAEKAGLGAAFRRIPHVCLSRAVAAPLKGARRVLWPAAPEEASLLDALESALADRLGL